MDPISQVIELEIELQRLAVEGENVIKYYNENPDKKIALISEYNKLKDKVVCSNIPNFYKNSILGSVDEYIKKLNPPLQEDKSKQDLLYLVVGALAGAVFVELMGKSFSNFEEGLGNGIVNALYNGSGFEWQNKA